MRKLSISLDGRFVPAARMTQKSKFVDKQAKRYRAWKKALAWEIKAKSRGRQMTTPCAVEIFIMTKRENFDGDNVEKGILDSLKYAGVIPNDTVKYVKDMRWAVRPRETEGLLIIVESI